MAKDKKSEKYGTTQTAFRVVNERSCSPYIMKRISLLTVESITENIIYIVTLRLWHVKRCIIRFIYVIILSFLFVFIKGILLFYHCILLLYILSISIQCPFISIVYFSIYILYLTICIH